MIAVAAALLALASPVVDRTLACSIPGTGYPDPARYLDVQVNPRLGSSSPNGGVFDRPMAADGTAVSFRTGPDFGRGNGFLWLKGCAATGSRPPLATTGLRSGQVRLGDRHKCDVPARTLVRVRAVFRRPVSFRASREGGSIAAGRIASIQLVVATARGRPIAYLAADSSTGTARLFTSRARCFPNR